VLLALANGLGVLTYFALWVLMPLGAPGSETEDTLDPFGQPKEERAPNEATNRAVVGGAVLVAVGLLLLLKNLGVLLWFRWDMVAPLMLMVGLLLLLKNLGVLLWFRWDMVAPLMLIVVGAIVVLNALREES